MDGETQATKLVVVEQDSISLAETVFIQHSLTLFTDGNKLWERHIQKYTP